MKTLIVYDSFFGNTEKVARAIRVAVEAANRGEVNILKVSQVSLEQIQGVQLLIVGSPTRAFSPSPAIRKLLGKLPREGLRGIQVAAFDTRMAVEDTGSRLLSFLMGRLGYAADSLGTLVKKKGGRLVAEPAGFIVNGAQGPLEEGELQRAEEWVRQIIDGLL